MKRIGLLISLLCAGQVAVLAGMIWGHQSVLLDGTEVVLEVQPVDPVSLFRGNYVDLNYAVGRLSADLFQGGQPPRRDDTVWVILAPPPNGAPADTPWHPVAASLLQPVIVPAGAVAMRGTVRNISIGVDADWNACGDDCGTIWLRYGIEAYYAATATAQSYEANVRDQDLTVVVAVAEDGRAIIKALMLDGVIVAREGLL